MGGKFEEGRGCKWRVCDGPIEQSCVTYHACLRIEGQRGECMQMRTFLVGNSTHCRGSDTVNVNADFGARVCNGGAAPGIMRDAKQWVRASEIHLSLRRPEVGMTTVTRLRDWPPIPLFICASLGEGVSRKKSVRASKTSSGEYLRKRPRSFARRSQKKRLFSTETMEDLSG